MSRTPKDPAAMAEFGAALTLLWEQDGKPSPNRLAKRMFTFGVDVSDDTIARALRGGTDPTQAGAQLLLGFCQVFECSPVDLGERAAAVLANVVTLAAAVGRRTEPGPDSDPATEAPRQAGTGGSDQSRWKGSRPHLTVVEVAAAAA